NPQLFNKALDWSLLFVGIGFTVIGIAGSNCFTNVQPIIISNLPNNSVYSTVVKLSVAATLFLTIPLALSPPLNLLEKLVFATKKQSIELENKETQPLLTNNRQHMDGYEKTELYNNQNHKRNNNTTNHNTITSLDE